MQRFCSTFEIFLFWLVAFLVVFIPLYPKFPLFNVQGTFAAVRLEDLFIAFTAVSWLIYIVISSKFKKILEDDLILALLLFFVIGLLSFINGTFVAHTVTPHLGILHYLRRIEFMILLPVTLTIVKTKRQLIFLLVIFSLVAFAVNIYAFGQQYLHWPVVSTTNSEFAKGQILYLSEEGRINSTFAGHYDLAIFLMMVLTVAAGLIFALRNVYLYLWGLILIGFSFVVLIMTASRFSFVAAVVGICLSFVFTGKKIVVLIILAAAILALIYPSELRNRFISTIVVNVQKGGQRYSPPPQVINSRHSLPVQGSATISASPAGYLRYGIAAGEPVDNTQLGVYRSLEIRLNVEWPRALNYFYKNPILGSGYSSLGLATDSDVLRSLGEVGIFGTLSFALIIYLIFQRLIKGCRGGDKLIRYFSAGVLSMLIALLLNTAVIDLFESSKVAELFWITMGINLGLVDRKI